VFVTTESGSGRLADWRDSQGQQGTAAGDAVCAALASRAGLPGTFRAWLSDSHADAYCRILGLSGQHANQCGVTQLPAAGPWISTLGEPFGASLDAILEGNIDAPIRGDQNGTRVATGLLMRTGTGFAGGIDPQNPSTCLEWTSSGSEQSPSSRTGYTAGFWTEDTTQDCGINERLYCFEVGTGPALPATPPGKLAFITSQTGPGDLGTWTGAGGAIGIAAGDNICRAAAADAGHSNASRFKAWLSDSHVDAMDRLQWPGPWVRPDGAVIALDKAQLASGTLSGTLSQNELGNYVLYNQANLDLFAWTGTSGAGRKTNDVCTDWTDNSNDHAGSDGLSCAGSRIWSDFQNSAQCGSYHFALYCFEDE
jgi:hypothetical protein